MSRSHLRNKYMKSCWHSITKTPHFYDEMSKNDLSKYVSIRCPGAWGFKQTGSRQGHQVCNEGRRIASGIVRAKAKNEAKREIQFSLENEEQDE